jgi:hypothetical protein
MCLRSSTFACQTRLLTWSKNSRLRTKRIEADVVEDTSEENTEATGEAVACAGVDEGAEEEVVGEVREDRPPIPTSRNLTYGTRPTQSPLK